MKKIIICVILILYATLSFNSCAFFQLDNYDEPSETLKGQVIDMDGNPVLTDQASEGIRVRLYDLEWEKAGNEVTPQDFYAKPDGTFQNTKLFSGEYTVTVDGPFVPIVIEDSEGVPLVDGSQTVNIEGTTEIEFQVQPFLNVEFVSEPQASDNQIIAYVKVTRAISRTELAEQLEQTGDWEDSYANVTDIQLFVGYSTTIGYSNRDEYWSNSITYSGSSFDAYEGQTIEIRSSSEHTIPSGRHMYVRAAARINYYTASVQRYNYSDIHLVVIP